MLERITIEAREIRAGDRLPSDYARNRPGVRITDTFPGERVIEVWTEDAVCMAMPCLTVSNGSPVTVWREVSR